MWKESFCAFKKRENYDKNKQSLNIVPTEVKSNLGKENEVFKDKLEYLTILDYDTPNVLHHKVRIL